MGTHVAHGGLSFNPSVLTDEFIAEYSSQAKADANFHVAGSPLREIISGLKSHNWYRQNPAVSGMASIEWSCVNKDDLFVLGRNLYQAACGDSIDAKAYLGHLSLKLGELEKEVAFHILNGMRSILIARTGSERIKRSITWLRFLP